MSRDPGSMVAIGTHLYLSLHFAEPTDNQNHYELSLPGYNREPVLRVAGNWDISGAADDRVTNRHAIHMSTIVGPGSTMVTHFAFGSAPSGQGVVLQAGRLSQPFVLTMGATASFKPQAMLFHTPGVSMRDLFIDRGRRGPSAQEGLMSPEEKAAAIEALNRELFKLEARR